MLFNVPGWLRYQITKTIHLSDVDFLLRGCVVRLPSRWNADPACILVQYIYPPLPLGCVPPADPASFLSFRPTPHFSILLPMFSVATAGSWRSRLHPSNVFIRPVCSRALSSHCLSLFLFSLPLRFASSSRYFLSFPSSSDLNHWYPPDPMCFLWAPLA